MRKIKAGKFWEFPIKVVGREGNYITININNGAIFVFEMYNRTIIRGWYDGLGGPKINDFGKLYIWNSKELNTKGNPKKDFTFSKKDLEDIIYE